MKERGRRLIRVPEPSSLLFGGCWCWWWLWIMAATACGAATGTLAASGKFTERRTSTTSTIGHSVWKQKQKPSRIRNVLLLTDCSTGVPTLPWRLRASLQQKHRRLSTTRNQYAFVPTPQGRRYRPPRQRRRQVNVNQSLEVTDQHEYTSQSLVACQLFFKATDDKGRGLQQEQRKKLVHPTGTLEALACANVTFPFTVPLLERQNDEKNQKQQRVDEELAPSSSFRTTSSSEKSYSLTIRHMIMEDLKSAILPMCVDEFGLGPTTSILDLGSAKTWRTQRTLANWWDRFTMEPMVSLALTTKIWLQERTIKATRNAASVNDSGSSNRFSDPTLLVVCLNEHNSPQRRSVNERSKDATTTKASATDAPRTTVIGMIEWSFQPPEASRNPPGFPPIPLWMKQLYCQLFPDGLSDPTPQGWITNLLIHPDHRGYGYSKLLVSAVEGVARSFNTPDSSISCQAIYLHADADIQGGRIPQALYEGMGYELIIESLRHKQQQQQQEQWGRTNNDSMSDDGFQMFFDSRIHMVDGVPLLFYCKRLDKGHVKK